MTYREAVLYGKRLLCEHGIRDAETDAYLLLEASGKTDRNFYYMHMNEELPEMEWEQYEALLERRAGHTPLQYITGEQEFMGLRFLVNRHVLIPRQDTEILVEEALRYIQPGMHVLDMCTGSGCIIVSILKNRPSVYGVAADISRQALLVAEENAKLNDVTAAFVESDLFCNVKGCFDLIVSNPPYIPTAEIADLMPEVRDYEPKEALDGSEDGLLFYRRILREGKNYLKPGGCLMLEIGSDQGEAVTDLMKSEGYQEIIIRRDLAGLDRVVTGKGRNYV